MGWGREEKRKSELEHWSKEQLRSKAQTFEDASNRLERDRSTGEETFLARRETKRGGNSSDLAEGRGGEEGRFVGVHALGSFMVLRWGGPMSRRLSRWEGPVERARQALKRRLDGKKLREQASSIDWSWTVGVERWARQSSSSHFL